MQISSKHLRQLHKEKKSLVAQNNNDFEDSFKLNLRVFNDITALVTILKYVKSLETGLTLDEVRCFLNVVIWTKGVYSSYIFLTG